MPVRGSFFPASCWFAILRVECEEKRRCERLKVEEERLALLRSK